MAFRSINPHNPSGVMGEFEEAGPYDVEIAVVRAREAFYEWREQPASIRGGALAKIATKKEILAPVAALSKAGSAEEAVQIANDVHQGHVAAVFTNDLDQAMEFAGRLEAGLVRVNAATVGVDCYVPFGDYKDSDTQPKVQSLAARDFYTQTRLILISAWCYGREPDGDSVIALQCAVLHDHFG